MKSITFNLLVFLVTTFVTNSFAQQPKNYEIHSGFAVGGGITYYTINTDNFKTTEGKGWLIKTSTTVDIPHKWYNVSYGIQISQNNIGVYGRSFKDSKNVLPLNYTITGAQLSLLWHAKTLKNHLTFDVGPMIQYNGKLELVNKEYETFLIYNFDAVTAEDIQEISHLNLVPAIGFTLGVSHLKVSAHYLYTLTNMLGRLNKRKLDTGNEDLKFKGHQHMIALSAMFTFN